MSNDDDGTDERSALRSDGDDRDAATTAAATNVDEDRSDVDEVLEADYDPSTPPDGGWGWVVTVASFFSNLIVDGVCYTFGVFFNEILDHFQASKSKTALVGSLVPGVYLLAGPIVSALANKFGCRSVTICGSLIAATFFFISSYSVNINMMLVTYGVMGGFGFGLMYLPSIVMVGYYFDKRRSLATGIAVCGSGVGTFVFAPVAAWLVSEFGWKGANIIIAGVILNGLAIGLTYEPLLPQRRRPLKSTIIRKILEQKQTRRRTFTENDESCITEDNRILPNGSCAAPPAARPPPPVTAVTDRRTATAAKDRTDEGIPLYHSCSSFVGRGIADSVEANGSAGLRMRRSRHLSISTSRRSLEKQMVAELATPFARKDVLFTGNIQNTAEFSACGRDMNEFVSSMRSLSPVAESTGNDAVDGEAAGRTEQSCWSPITRIITEMFDFSLLKSPAFLLICVAGVFGYLGVFTPFVYVTQKAETELGVPKSQASLILSVLGVCNTVSRVVAGFVADMPCVDVLLVSNVAAIVAGAATCVVPLLNTYALLVAYSAVFGVFIAAFIALRSIVIVEILGLQKLTNAFGIMSLFQGVAVLVGSPMSGAILDATGSFFGPFVVSGTLIALAGVVCLPVRRIARWEAERNTKKSASDRYRTGAAAAASA